MEWVGKVEAERKAREALEVELREMQVRVWMSHAVAGYRVRGAALQGVGFI